MIPILDTASALEAVVGSSSAQFGAMAAHEIWMLEADTDLFYSQGANPTATAGAGSSFLAKGQQALLDGSFGAKVAVLQDSVAGKATLSRVIRE